jgi:hypothetical protein
VGVEARGEDGWEPQYPAARSELVLESVLVSRDGRPERLSLAAPVREGDGLAFELSAPSPLHVYLVNLAPDGGAKLVWPHDTREVGPEGVRVPESGWFQLTAPSGPEVAAFIGVRAEVPQDEEHLRFLTDLAQREAARTDLMRLQAAEPPGFVGAGFATTGMRAADLRAEGPRVRAFGHDTVVLLVDLDHRPARP